MSEPIIAVVGRTVQEADAYGERLLKVPFVPFAEHQWEKLSRHNVENFICCQTVGELPAAMIRTLAERMHDADQQRQHYS